MQNRPKVKVLRPIKETVEDYDALEAKIVALFRKEIYVPLLKELGEPQKVLNSGTLKNSRDDLLEAIRSGRVTFSKGTFSGRFDSAISKELRSLGARWDRRTGTYKVSTPSLPIEVRQTISASEYKFQEKIAGIDRKLAKILPEEIADKLNVESIFDTSLWKTDKDLKATLKGLTVPPLLTKEARERIAKEWQTNMRLWIKDFTEKEILKLRSDMQKAVFTGNRYETAVKKIQASYGVSQNKAKFLARQETSLLMTKFKEVRYADAGVKEYVWGCVAGSPKHPVRAWHKALEGKTFRWDTPPITTKPGEPVRRNNPGQDYNCRCFAKPVVRFK